MDNRVLIEAGLPFHRRRRRVRRRRRPLGIISKTASRVQCLGFTLILGPSDVSYSESMIQVLERRRSSQFSIQETTPPLGTSACSVCQSGRCNRRRHQARHHRQCFHSSRADLTSACRRGKSSSLQPCARRGLHSERRTSTTEMSGLVLTPTRTTPCNRDAPIT